ncbi:hypothetical protein ACF0H5_017566 [Mactra antiquata]
MLFVYLVCSGILWTIASGTDCPSFWIVFEDSCYRFEHNTLSFAQAEEYCRQHDSHLVHIETARENSFLKEFVKYMDSTRWWIGLTDDDLEGYWVWHGTDVTPTFTDWHSGEPSSSGGNEDCADLLLSGGKWAWNDENCNTHRHPAICEKNKNVEVAVIG